MNPTSLPPGQRLAAPGKWPVVGEREPRTDTRPWMLNVHGLVDKPRSWSLDELRQFAWVEQTVDIHCVTRWSRPAMRFRGIPLQSLLESCAPHSTAKFISFVARSVRAHSTSLEISTALKAKTLVALECDGQPLPLQHGGPIRPIVPERYFYKSVKWLESIELLEQDRLGYWESEAGYHNEGDPWREQRYVVSDVPRPKLQELLRRRSFAGENLLSLELQGHDLANLDATGAILRNADFRHCKLRGATFTGANLTNSRFMNADLRDSQLNNADLEGCDFSGADLRGADLRGSSLFGADFTAIANPLAPAQSSMTSINSTTQFDLTSIEQLVPEQAAFVLSQIHQQE